MGNRARTVAVTRPASPSEPLRQGLEAAGFKVLECPAIEIVPAANPSELDNAIARLPSYHWLLFTSANAVDFFFERLRHRQKACRVPIVVVGSATAERVRQWQHVPALQPPDDEFRAEGVLKLFPDDLTGKRVLFPRAESARELLPEELRRRGAEVDVVTVYRTRENAAGMEMLKAHLQAREIDCVVFTSPSAVRAVVHALSSDLRVLDGVCVAVLGPIVRQAASSTGLNVDIEPGRALIADLVRAITDHFATQAQ